MADRRVTLLLATLPFVISFFVVGGVFLGFYVASLIGSTGKVVFPLLFSTAGLAASLLVSYLLTKKALTK